MRSPDRSDAARVPLKLPPVPGRVANGVTNKSVFDWSSNPLAGKKVYLVGDSWYPLGSGWANAAYITSIRVLNDHFGFTMPSHELPSIACP